MHAHSRLPPTVAGAANRASPTELMSDSYRARAPLNLSAEYRRAIAAERRYDELKRMGATSLAREGLAATDISTSHLQRILFLGKDFGGTTRGRTRETLDDNRNPLQPENDMAPL